MLFPYHVQRQSIYFSINLKPCKLVLRISFHSWGPFNEAIATTFVQLPMFNYVTDGSVSEVSEISKTRKPVKPM